jgi:hypothetical protein
MVGARNSRAGIPDLPGFHTSATPLRRCAKDNLEKIPINMLSVDNFAHGDAVSGTTAQEAMNAGKRKGN